MTQNRFKTRVEDLVTLAIQSVFNRDFKFELIFEQKRNKFECRPVIMEGDSEYVPKDDMGGGILDIIAFALRVVLWSLENPRSRNLIILDEPMRFVGRALVQSAGNMIKEISHRLNIQILLVTHEMELTELGDCVYKVTHVGGLSKVENITHNPVPFPTVESPVVSKIKRRKA